MTLLYICVENRARSQMAEGLTRHLLDHKFDVLSAGSKPSNAVHPMAIAAMAEIGIDISEHKPKALDSIDLANVDTVISLCAEEQCPAMPADTKHISWPLPDPAVIEKDTPQSQLRSFRKIRDELRKKILEFGQHDTW